MSKVQTPLSKMKRTLANLRNFLPGYHFTETNSKAESQRLLDVIHGDIPSHIARADQAKVFMKTDEINFSFLSYYEDVKAPYIIVIKSTGEYDFVTSQPFGYQEFNFALKEHIKHNKDLKSESFIESLSALFFDNALSIPVKQSDKFKEQDTDIAAKEAQLNALCAPFYSLLNKNELPIKTVIADKDKEIKAKYESSEEFKTLQAIKLQLKKAEEAAEAKLEAISHLYRPKSFNADYARLENTLTDMISDIIISMADLFDSNNKDNTNHALIVMIRNKINELAKAYSENATDKISYWSMHHFISQSSKINSRMKMINTNKINNLRNN